MSEALRILIIEDRDQDAKLLVRHLERQGLPFTHEWVANAAELTAALQRPERDWNLILSDYALPDIDIRNRLHWIMARLPDVPVILVSGTIGEETAVDLLKDGVEDFVGKENLTRLVPAIRRALAGRATRQARRRAEQALELRNRALEAASNGVLIAAVGDDMPVVYVNPSVTRITGYTAEELLGRNCRFLQRDDRDQPGIARIREALAQEVPCQVILRNYHKDGTLFWNRLNIAPVREHGGRVTHYVGVQEDVTRQKINEDRLRQSAAVFENSSEGMVVTGLDGTIVEVNQAFVDITGYSREEALGRNPRFLKSGRHDDAFYQAMWTSLQRTGHWRGELWNRRKDGDVYPEWLTISTVCDENGQACSYVGVFADITDVKQSEEQIEYLAHHDPLTGLPNRLLFNARLEHTLERARRDGHGLAVLYLDLDRFKTINDFAGHAAGDELLKAVGERLRHCVRLDDTVARFGGDEFVILLERIAEPGNAGTVARKILLGFTEPFQLGGLEQYVTASIGISVFPGDGTEVGSLVRNADIAMYQVKDRGRQGFHYYTAALTRQAAARAVLETDLHKALDKEQLYLAYQPQVDFRSGRLIGVEALVRWRHPDHGIVSPAEFIPIAEESGQIIEIGRWVLTTACRQGRLWLDAGLDFGRVSVNVAGDQIRRGDLGEVVAAALQATGLPAQHLELEVTEGFIMRQAEKAIEHMAGLRRLGVTLAIDDFGTGYSSLSYLKRLPVNRLKIDQSFIRGTPGDADDAAITRAIIALARSLGLDAIAEGVETAEQQGFLAEEGCSLAQGYLFGRPLPPDELEAWVRGKGAPAPDHPAH